ncbi:hypothetical protein Cob_v009768 [Colletotrichum orbiculare MAFF 240422]|uniref:Uncharacterized protein n=1 Tax=Colletotrichum orbiculare (strain 104-T / ATCC 96160 / CBS 514.97 / LARS 414 / MAFF 240422) TaxID=1213857 RepID=A0A484FHZ5_COLOR|nr:hypothetical protein Cob_v009768 [Colletotrichum orbiculare MAFF 240422]
MCACLPRRTTDCVTATRAAKLPRLGPNVATLPTNRTSNTTHRPVFRSPARIFIITQEAGTSPILSRSSNLKDLKTTMLEFVFEAAANFVPKQQQWLSFSPSRTHHRKRNSRFPGRLIGHPYVVMSQLV